MHSGGCAPVFRTSFEGAPYGLEPATRRVWTPYPTLSVGGRLELHLASLMHAPKLLRTLFITITASFAFHCAHAEFLFQTFAGHPQQLGTSDGHLGAARFSNPTGAAVDLMGNIYISDTANQTIRKISPDGEVSTLAGAAGQIGDSDGTGSAARFNYPWGIAVDPDGNIFVCDTSNHTIRKITPAGVVSTFAGSPGIAGSEDGTGEAARFDRPSSIAVDPTTGNLFVTDYGNTIIRRITPSRVVTTFAGAAGQWGSADGLGAAARFSYPDGIAIDTAGTIFVADSNNHTIRQITPTGEVTTLAGTTGVSGSVDGLGASARFNKPTGIVADNTGNIYVADSLNNTIRKIFPNGFVLTVGGLADTEGSEDGLAEAARFRNPVGLALTLGGRLLIADTFNNTVRAGDGEERVADFDSDGESDIILENRTNGDRYIWLMHGTNIIADRFIAKIPSAWRITATGDFDGDGHEDLVLQNDANGLCFLWLMNGSALRNTVFLGTLDIAWRIVASADFDRDGDLDIILQNTSTGDRYIWLMTGTSISSAQFLANLSPDWDIAAVGNFNGDDSPDLVLQNTVTGDRYIWLMNGTAVESAPFIGAVTTNWRITGAADFNGDGFSDILLENSFTGDRYLWTMNGAQIADQHFLGRVTTDWVIAN